MIIRTSLALDFEPNPLTLLPFLLPSFPHTCPIALVLQWKASCWFGVGLTIVVRALRAALGPFAAILGLRPFSFLIFPSLLRGYAAAYPTPYRRTYVAAYPTPYRRTYVAGACSRITLSVFPFDPCCCSRPSTPRTYAFCLCGCVCLSVPRICVKAMANSKTQLTERTHVSMFAWSVGCLAMYYVVMTNQIGA